MQGPVINHSCFISQLYQRLQNDNEKEDINDKQGDGLLWTYINPSIAGMQSYISLVI